MKKISGSVTPPVSGAASAAGACICTLEDVQFWRTIYEKKAQVDSRAEVVLHMIQDFNRFCDEYRTQFDPLLKSKTQEWLDRAIDDALLVYWQPLRRAAHQYQAAQWAAQDGAEGYQELFKLGYEELDELKKQLASRLGREIDIPITLYFEKTGKAKRYPFGNAYLIGIPLIDAYARDWNAIPHELGHHFYWSARFSSRDNAPVAPRGKNFLSREVEAALSQLGLEEDPKVREALRKLLGAWTEEIFADVIGAKIAEPKFVDAAWNRVRSKVAKDDEKHLFLSDGEHPMPYSLPYIRTFAANADFSQEAFDEIWKEYYGGTRYKVFVSHQAGEKATPILLRTFLAALKSYIEQIASTLEKIKIDPVVPSASQVTELKDFLHRETGKEDEDLLLELLNPVILERHENWTCRCGKVNVHDTTTCPECGYVRHRPTLLESLVSTFVH